MPPTRISMFRRRNDRHRSGQLAAPNADYEFLLAARYLLFGLCIVRGSGRCRLCGWPAGGGARRKRCSVRWCCATAPDPDYGGGLSFLVWLAEVQWRVLGHVAATAVG